MADIPRNMIDIHADDFALTVNTSKEMLELMYEGVLDSISIIPNNACYDECMQMLKDSIPSLPFLPKMSVHLNLVEGYYVSDPEKIIHTTWKDLFLSSFIPGKRRAAYAGLLKETTAQLTKVWTDIRDCIEIAKNSGIRCDQERIRIDSHQHTHMIPIVWDSMVESLERSGLVAEYIRNSKEPLGPFLTRTSLWSTYRPVNLIKNRILYVMSGRADRYDRTNDHEPMFLWGLVMSGKMDADRIKTLFPYMAQYAKVRNRRLEILFHPGRMTESELTAEIPRGSADDFYLSEGRHIERSGARFISERIKEL